jgi:DNA-directed RNA polymerase subunit beta'
MRKRWLNVLKAAVWDVLEDVIKEHPVMLNRAPTLHRLGIQAFEPVLVEGKAIKLHPLVCTAYNADFDGDQMAVHVPLSVEAQAECRFLLLSPNNLLKPSDGAPVAVPSQDMVLGTYYLTLAKDGEKGEGHVFKDANEAILAYENAVVSLHAKIRLQRSMVINGVKQSRIIDTTVGRIIFNEAIPQDLGFVERTTDDSQFLYEVEFLVGKKQLQNIIRYCINVHGSTTTAEVLDEIKKLGFKFSTRGALTVSISDMEVPEEKPEIIEGAMKTVENIMKQFKRGMMTEEERYQNVIDTWRKADEKLTKALLSNLDQYNNIYMMAHSGARGSDNQIKQLAGMRGLMSDTSGRTIELPIKSNFREGLDVLEYFISAHGARKGLADTALRTADSGYLTRRLVDVSQDLIVRETDCCSKRPEVAGMTVKAFMDGKEMIESLEERISGRWSIDEIVSPESGEVLVEKDTMISPIAARLVIKAGISKVKIRTALTCRSEIGVCAKCYGANMATGIPVQVGETAGIIAAQSIGEPGTQLTMRTFHTGGIATADDITQGLPRIEELFEARKPKGLAILAEFGGKAMMNETKKKREMIVTNAETGESKAYLIPYGSRTRVFDGDMVEAGDELTEGSVNPHDILKIKGVRPVQDYILKEVQRVYRLQGVEINDKHVEVICRQMLKKVRIENNGDSPFLPGSLVDRLEYERINEELASAGLEEAEGIQVMLGITKASLATNSFLSAASFQETTKVLTEAAILGKTDPLIGLKENVIIGKLIPAGTGMKRYRDVEIKKVDKAPVVVHEYKANFIDHDDDDVFIED